jgi:REP element-mobilizing transposase RayT
MLGLTVILRGTGVSSQSMKGQRIRYQQTGEFHFLTFSCYHRLPYLAPVGAIERFENALELTRCRYQFAIAGYVVMPEHVHLLVNEPRRALLSTAIQASQAVRHHAEPGKAVLAGALL